MAEELLASAQRLELNGPSMSFAAVIASSEEP